MRMLGWRSGSILLGGLLISSSAIGQQSLPARFHDMFPTWSPDGKQIAFVSDRSGDPEVYVAQADGTKLRQLTHVAGRDAHPSWSRDGRTLFFQSPRDGGEVRIFAMGRDGSGQHSLANTKGFCGVPFQSPTGRALVFQCSGALKDFGSKANPWRIYLLDRRGSAPRAITFGPGNDQVATWSPDGRRILFFSDRSGSNQLYELTLRSGRMRQVTRGPAEHSSASYAPDGRRIALMRAEPGKKGDVFVLRPPNGFVRVTDTGPQFGTPMFSPDGRRLLFQMPTAEGSRLFVAAADGTGVASRIDFRP